MGHHQSSVIYECPWSPLHGSGKFTPEFEEKIKSLSLHIETFLKPHPSLTQERLEHFSFEDFENFEESTVASIQFDQRIAKWLPNLVPKKVSEEAFWVHYLSHVEYIISMALEKDIIYEDSSLENGVTLEVKNENIIEVKERSAEEIISTNDRTVVEHQDFDSGIKPDPSKDPMNPCYNSKTKVGSVTANLELPSSTSSAPKSLKFELSPMFTGKMVSSVQIKDNILEQFLIEPHVLNLNVKEKKRIGLLGVYDPRLHSNSSSSLLALYGSLSDCLVINSLYRNDLKLAKELALHYNISNYFDSLDKFIDSADIIIVETGVLLIGTLLQTVYS